MAATTDTRERIVSAASALFMQQGLSASGLKAIAEQGTCTIGSLYHFFPGGKSELAAATLRQSGLAYQELVAAVLGAAPDVVTGTRECFAAAAENLRASGYADACPIATVALEVVSSDEELRVVIDEVFGGWLDALTQLYVAGGIAPARARELATIFLAALEGGFLLCRVARDVTPMAVLGETVAQLVAAAAARRPMRQLP
jgi:AcrR family transcriptional regulator